MPASTRRAAIIQRLRFLRTVKEEEQLQSQSLPINRSTSANAPIPYLVSRVLGLTLFVHTPACQPMNTEKTNGESTPPAITSFSPARSGASSLRKCSPMDSPLTIVPSVLQRSRA